MLLFTVSDLSFRAIVNLRAFPVFLVSRWHSAVDYSSYVHFHEKYKINFIPKMNNILRPEIFSRHESEILVVLQ